MAELKAKLASSTVAAVDSSSTENQNVSQPTNTSLRLRIKPEYFSAAPGDNWFTWVWKFKNIAQLNNWKDDVTQKVLPAYLKGRAEQIYYSLTQEELASWMTVPRECSYQTVSPARESTATQSGPSRQSTWKGRRFTAVAMRYFTPCWAGIPK